MNFRKFLFIMLFGLPSPWILVAQKQHPAKLYHLLIGTYTDGTSKGIYVYKFNPVNGKMTYETLASGIKDPSYLAVSADKRFVYAVNESHNQQSDSVSAFKFDNHSGKLTFLNRLSSYGTDPCYVSVDKKNRNLFVANYSSGSLTAYALKADGSLRDTLQTIKHTGSGIDKSRQKTAHVHAVVLSPDEKYLFADDLGEDKVYKYNYQPDSKNPLSPANNPTIAVKPGSGPRHLIFSADAKHAYLTQEMGALVTVFNYANGKLSLLQTINMEEATFKGQNGAADLHLSPDGKFLYATNRGEANDILVYKINSKSGKLSFVERKSSLGKGPRNFAIDPTGNFLLAANQITNDIFTFKINKTTGKLTRFGTKLQIDHPVCLKFVAAR